MLYYCLNQILQQNIEEGKNLPGTFVQVIVLYLQRKVPGGIFIITIRELG